MINGHNKWVHAGYQNKKVKSYLVTNMSSDEENAMVPILWPLLLKTEFCLSKLYWIIIILSLIVPNNTGTNTYIKYLKIKTIKKLPTVK